MYSVVGCNQCNNLWLVEGRPETTQCLRCGKRHRFEKLKQFVTTDEEDHAREVRASMLANRGGHGEAFADLDSFAEMEARTETAGMDDAEYLECSGIDAGEVEAAADRSGAGNSTGGSTSKRQVVRNALSELDRPTEEEVAEYAEERGVSASYVEKALEKLARRGEVSESRGQYRLL